MKQGAIFDMDGLLFDTERLYQESWVQTAADFGQTPDPAFPKAICGTSGEHSLEVIRTHYPAVDEKAFLVHGVAWVQRQVAQGAPEKPGVHEILTALRGRGVKLAVASSSSRAMIEGNLRHAGILELFDAVVSGDEVTRGKPEPDIFLLAADKIGCKPQDCYVFEDGFNGVRAGAAAGCATIMIPDLMQPDDALRALCAGVYPSLLDALEHL